ncbi:MAG: putative hydroxymethylpyrimidine transporter CytX [Candidatus Hecatellaceae archaeon]
MEAETSIQPIPPDRRSLSAIQLALIWLGAGISIAEIWAGNLLAPALPLLLALTVNLAGHLLGNGFMAAVAHMGCKVGVPTMVLVRGSFGVRGSYLASALNYLQLIGWTAVMILIGGKALDMVSQKFLGSATLYPVWALLLGLATTLWAYAGPRSWRKIQPVSVGLLGVLSVWMGWVAITVSGGKLLTYQPTWEVSVGEAFDLVAAMPVSWAPLVADYSRLGFPGFGSALATYFGYMVSSFSFYAVGAISSAGIGASDPLAVIAGYGLGIPALLIIVLSTTTTTFLDIYSGAITWKNMRPKDRLSVQIWIVGLAGTMLALFFPMEKYEWFLLWIGASFFPLVAIMIADYYLLRRSYLGDELVKTGGAYWYLGGFNPKALACWAAGFIFYVWLIQSGLAATVGATLPTVALTMLLYYVLAKVGG